MENRLLIIDDNKDNLDSLRMGFERSSYTVLTALGGPEGISVVKNEPVDVIITDLQMPGVDGMGILEFTRGLTPKPSVILLTAYGTIESAVDALSKGAFTYLTKPINLSELRVQVDKAMEHQRLVMENFRLRKELKGRYSLGGMIGQSEQMENIYAQIRQIANTKATVLIQGASGTGKELVARAIHFGSNRSEKPFIPIHCAALSESLLETELFGHEKGAFTGAIEKHMGRFELADGGTLFLDEITEIPRSVQVKLLRVLETKEFMRVGGVKSVKVDIRLVAATNRDLHAEVEKGNFREDLYYRLKVVDIEIPPLNQRPDDIPLLVKHFIDEFAKEHGKEVSGITKEAMDRLSAHSWRGNVRELRNCIENIIVFLQKTVIDVNALPPSMTNDSDSRTGEVGQVKDGATLEEVEKYHILQALKSTGGNKSQAAKQLGISRRTLHRRLSEMKMDEEMKIDENL